MHDLNRNLICIYMKIVNVAIFKKTLTFKKYLNAKKNLISEHACKTGWYNPFPT